MRADRPARTPPAQSRLRRRGPLLVLAALLMLALALAFWRFARHHEALPTTAAAATPVVHARLPAGAAEGTGMPVPAERARRHRELLQRLRFADHTYCSYRAASRYPPGARPMADNPDQNTPNAPVAETNPMRLDGGGSDSEVRIQTTQSRVYLAAGETVAFTIRAVDAAGSLLPLVITRALARGIVYGAARPAPQVALSFADDGRGADPAANDGAYAAMLAPGQSGLAGFGGTIRTEVRYTIGSSGRSGVVNFDVIHTPELPAVWSGPVREAVENGSLHFYLQAEVRMPGRYIVSGRVDDARGRPFALLTFNDVLGPGPNEIDLTVFGKLLRDRGQGADAALPLTLRDVDGYLLKENADPDRALMPRLEGKVHTSKAYAPDGFSDAEWQSEERSRYLAEFGRDLARTREELRAFDPGQPMPQGECAGAQPPLTPVMR